MPTIFPAQLALNAQGIRTRVEADLSRLRGRLRAGFELLEKKRRLVARPMISSERAHDSARPRDGATFLQSRGIVSWDRRGDHRHFQMARAR